MRLATLTPSDSPHACFGDIQVRFVERQAFDERRHLAENREDLLRRRPVLLKVRPDDGEAGQSRTARDMGIAERTPNLRAS
jgi:hypothetical protein